MALRPFGICSTAVMHTLFWRKRTAKMLPRSELDCPAQQKRLLHIILADQRIHKKTQPTAQQWQSIYSKCSQEQQQRKVPDWNFKAVVIYPFPHPYSKITKTH